MNYACEAAIGAVCGLRSLTGPAIVAGAANRNVLNLEQTPLAWLSSGRASQAATLLAVGELIADKLPFMPNRTDPPGLVTRFITGAICGVALANGRTKQQQKNHHKLLSGLVAGAAAVAASYAGYQYRKRVKLHPLAAAVLEDLVAVGVGKAVVSSFCP